MKRMLVVALSLMLLSPAVFAAQSNSAAEDEDSIVPSNIPKKVDMRPLGNNPALTGKKVVTVDQLTGAAGAAGKIGTPDAGVGGDQGQKMGKYLPSNRNANGNTVQDGGIVVDQGQKTGKYLPSNKNANNNTVQNGAIVVDQGQKAGKFLPSNRNANNDMQLQGVPGGVVTAETLEGGGKKNHRNINQRSNEVLGDGF